MRVYGFVWPVWMVRDDGFSCDNFNKLPDVLPTTLTDDHQVFIQQLLNLYSGTVADNPLNKFWILDASMPKPDATGNKTEDAAAKTAWEKKRVKAMVVALKIFWEKICGQLQTELPAANQSLLCVMNGTTARFLELRATGTKLHEWAIYEKDPNPTPAPPPKTDPPPGAPTQTVTDDTPENKKKRAIEDGTKGDTPENREKKLKASDVALKQEDVEMLSANFDVTDIDEEGGYDPSINIGVPDSQNDAEILSDNQGSDATPEDSDAEMPEVKGDAMPVQKDFVQIQPATQSSPSAAPKHVLVASTPSAPIAGATIPIRTTTQANKTVAPLQSKVVTSATVTAADSPNASPPASPFYLCGSDFAHFTPDTIQAPLSPATTSNAFSDWIANLNNGYIILATPWKQPATGPNNTPPPSPAPVSAKVHAADEWFQRLYYNRLGIQQASLVGYIDTANAFARVTAVNVQLNLGVVADTPISLTFSSDASSTISMGATAVATPPALGDAMVTDYGLMTLGLQSTSQAQLTVGQIISYFGMTYLPIGTTGGFSLPGFDPVSSLTTTIDTSLGSRSSLTFKPDVLYSTWLRLRFAVTDPAFATTFQTNFSFLGSITLSNTAIVVLSKAECPSDFVQRDLTSQCGLETQITLGSNFDSLSISAWVKFEYNKTSIVLEFNNSYTWSQIQGWLVSVLSNSSASNDRSIDPTPLLPNSSNISFAVRNVTLVLGNPGSASGFSLLAATILFEVSVYNKTIFSLELDWPGPSITARLWNSIAPDVSTYALLPYIEPYDRYTPLGQPTGAVDFADFCGNDVTPPPGGMNLSPTFYELTLTASYDSSKQLRYLFSGTLQSLPLTSGSGVPRIVLGDLDFSLQYSKGAGTDVLLSTSVMLIPRDFPATLASQLTVSVEYIDQGLSSSWQVTGSAVNVSFATLYNLFDSDASDAVMDILGTLEIPELEVIWDYSTGDANLFVTGILRVGPFELDLSYQYFHGSSPGQSSWTFRASLGSHMSQSSTLYDLIQALGVDQDVLNTLADVQFVANIEIPAATPVAGSQPPVSLSITKEPDKETIFWIQIAISTANGTLSFTYIQLQGARSAASALTPPPGFKRVIRVLLDRLPTVPGVPVVGPIPQPVDAIDYIWIGDSTVDNTAQTAGLTLSDISLINSTMSADNSIPFKNTQSSLQNNSPGNASSVNANPYVLLAGHHFLVQANGNVILDHLFGKGGAPPVAPQAMLMAATPSLTATPEISSASKPSTTISRVKQTNTRNIPAAKNSKKSKTTTAARFTATAMMGIADDNTAAGPAVQQDSGSTKAPLSRSIGPLTIHNIGLQTKNGYLYMLLDATVALGPIQLTVTGFGVGMPLSRFNLNELKNLVITDFDIALSGMSVYFNSPPVLISGVFQIDSTPAYEAYKGGLAISIDPYSLLAVGEYQHTYSSDLKSVFIFGRFDGPLLTLEFAEISGVEVGYNYSIRTPNAADVLNFPLVQGVTASNDPMETLTHFSRFVSVEQDSVWLAFGFKLDAVQVISMDAAALVQFSASDITVAIVGIASASMPPHVKNRNEMFLYAELGVVAALDITGGSLTCQAQLTPNSFVLYPDCHLVGGFALCYWFGPSPHAGDWVFTVGGYHPAYKPPSYYPVVPRVGINWNLSNVLTVTGQGYFAITPKACMGGGQLVATFNAGPIYATFRAWASFLINFKPFFFQAEIGVSVTCGFECDIGLIHINIHADISAVLNLSGPPFGGVVHVDLKIHNFSIYFGNQNNAPTPLNWTDFLELVRQTRPPTNLTSTGNSSALIVPTLVAGAATEKITSGQGQTGDIWTVRAGGVSFRIECKFPIDDLSWGDGVIMQSWRQSAGAANDPAAASPPIYTRPMQLTSPCTSLLTVSIVSPVPPTDVASDKDKPWTVSACTKNLPDALWTQYDPNQDPIASKSNNISSLLNPPDASGTTHSHLIGFTFTAPPPVLPDPENVLPEFNAVTAMSEGVFQDGSNNPSGKSSPLLPPNPSALDERPHLRPTPVEQTGGLPAPPTTDGSQWTKVQSAWSGVNSQIARDLVSVWTKLAGWDEQPPLGTVSPGSGEEELTDHLVADQPGMVLASFEEWYQSCPLLVQVVS
ncbi:MAG: hypothetical protein Q9191_000239 [Dirinaria sp. TL-2023a]